MIGDNHAVKYSFTCSKFKNFAEAHPADPFYHSRFSATGDGAADTVDFRHLEMSTMSHPLGVTMLRNCPKHVKMTTLKLFTEEDVIDYSIGT